MHWKVKALLQKILATTRLGDQLNHIPATINKNYHYNVVHYQTYECVRKFAHTAVDLSKEKIALEIGTGYSLIASVVLSLLGFHKVITVDITKDVRFKTFKKQAAYFTHSDVLPLIQEHSIFSEKELLQKIEHIKKSNSLEELLSTLNITYIAPYNFEELLKIASKFDYITSQVVLEHMPPKSLEKLFEFTEKALQKDHHCIHTINFIDHFANPGFFQDKSISEFNFLKYSDRSWKFWAGNSIAYTNRLSHRYYLDLCKKYNLTVVDFLGENYRERKELPLDCIHKDVIKKYKSDVAPEELTKYQRGTLVITKNT
jgi:hypothetical protein